MNCNNCTNNNALKEVKIKHVHGNVLRMAIPLTLRTIELVDGEINATDTPFIPSSEHPVKVVFSKGSVSVALDATMKDGNIAYIEEKGKIPVGTYAITVTCNDDNGNPYRFKQNAVLYVADATIEAGIEETIEYEVTTWYLDAAIFLALKGEDGVGIYDIDTQSSGEIGGVNTVTFILTDGRTRSFDILNGSGAVDSDLDINSPSPIANSAVTAKFNELSGELADLFGDVDYDTSSKSIRFWDKGKTNVLASLDARPFIKDGMVSNAYISNNTLVITFNTDSGKEAIGVPLTSVFNPNNYYTKTQVDSRIASAVANINLTNYYTKSQVDSLYSSLSSRVTPVEVIFAESNDSITSNRTVNGIYTDYTNKKTIIGRYGNSVGTLLYISSQEAAFIFGDRYDKPFILRNSGSTHWGKEDLVDGSLSIEIDANPTVDSENAVSSGGVYNAIQNFVSAIKVNNETPKYPVDGLVSLTIDSGGYEPPAGGIPKSDLAQSVQDTLDDVDNKVDKETGKGLSTNDYTTAEKTKLAGLENYDDSALQTAIDGKVDKESGKSLMTDAERTKLQGIAAGAEVNVQPNWTQTNASADDYIKNKPTLATVATSGSYNDLSNKPTIPDTSTFATKTELNGKQDVINDLASIRINSGKGVADMSSNADGTVVTTLANGDTFTIDLNHEHPQYVESEDLADVATSGSYNDLFNKPTIPAAQVQSDWNATTGMGVILNKPNLATVATSGAYSDLSGTPTIPSDLGDLTNNAGYTKNTGTITGITMNGASKGTSGVVDLGTVITSHQDISGKANASEMSVSTSGDQTTITLKSGTSATVINQHQSLSGYVQATGITNIVVCANEQAYTNISPKDSNTLYLIKESNA